MSNQSVDVLCGIFNEMVNEILHTYYVDRQKNGPDKAKEGFSGFSDAICDEIPELVDVHNPNHVRTTLMAAACNLAGVLILTGAVDGPEQ